MSRRDSHGRPVPELADYLDGLQVLAQLRATGLDLAPDQAATTALGRALRESEPGPGHDRELRQMIEAKQEQNQTDREMLAQIPTRRPGPCFICGLDHGQLPDDDLLITEGSDPGPGDGP